MNILPVLVSDLLVFGLPDIMCKIYPVKRISICMWNITKSVEFLILSLAMKH